MASQAPPPNPGVLPPGAMHTVVWIDDPSTSKLLVKAYAFCYSPPPRVDWDDGTAYAAMTLGLAGTGGQPDRYEATHTYGAPGSYSVKCWGPQVSETRVVSVGDLTVWDPRKSELTWKERWQIELDRKAAIDQVKSQLGPDDNSVGGYTVTNPTTTQADA